LVQAAPNRVHDIVIESVAANGTEKAASALKDLAPAILAQPPA